MSLFLGSSSSRGGGLASPSLYSSTSTSSIGSSRLYNRSASYNTSDYGSGTSYGSRYYSRATSSYLDNYRTTSNTPASSRSLRFQNSIDRAKIDQESQKTRQIENAQPNNDHNGTPPEDTSKRPKARHRATVLNGSVIRIRRNQPVNESSDEEEDDEGNESEEESEEDSVEPATESEDPPPEIPARPSLPPEDPLVVEERMLNAQLALSFTLTMTDEENIRQRLLEIRKQRMKKSQSETETVLLDKFEKESEELCESTRAKEEEEKILVQRLAPLIIVF